MAASPYKLVASINEKNTVSFPLSFEQDEKSKGFLTDNEVYRGIGFEYLFGGSTCFNYYVLLLQQKVGKKEKDRCCEINQYMIRNAPLDLWFNFKTTRAVKLISALYALIKSYARPIEIQKDILHVHR